ncbi:MAG: hypothetical protein ACOC3T_00710 [Bacteroidota bacterium]
MKFHYTIWAYNTLNTELNYRINAILYPIEAPTVRYQKPGSKDPEIRFLYNEGFVDKPTHTRIITAKYFDAKKNITFSY